MKSKHLLLMLLLALFVPWAAMAQTLTIGDGTSYSPTGSSSPTATTNGAGSPMGNAYYYCSTAQFIYTAEELGTAKTINSVAFYHNDKSLVSTVKIYLFHTTESTVNTSSYVTSGTPLYTGTNITLGGSSAGWQTFTLETPFEYNGTDNLLVVVCRTKRSDGGTPTYLTALAWQYTSTSENYRYMMRSNDTESNVALSNTTTAYVRSYYRPNIQIEYELPSSCEKPATCEVSDVTHNSATLTWSGGSGTYNVQVKGGDWADWTEILHETTLTTKDLEDLTMATNYQARVQSVCASENSGWMSTSFTTECGPAGIGYQCGFEGPNTGGTTSYPLPACWTRTGTSTYYPYAYNSGSHLGSYCLYFSGSSSTDASAMLPEIEGGVNGKRLSFYLKVSNTAVSMSVGYLNGTNTFVEVESVAPTTTYSYQLMEVDFANIEGNPTNMVLKFKSTYNNTAYAYIDDLELKAIPTCFRPTMATTATNIGPTTATVSWTAGGTNQDRWDVYYSSDYTAPTSSSVPQVQFTADNPCILTGLTPSTSYRVYVRGNCGTQAEPDYSEWSTNYCTFTTPAYCADMQVQYSTITFSDITYNSANVSWTIAGEATEWKVQCSQDNTFATIDKEVIANTNSAALSGLTAEKTYYVRIAPYCAEATDYTPWSSYKSFSTPESCPAPVLAEPTNTTAYGATLTWTGTSDHYDVMVGEETITPVLDANFENNQIPTGFTNSTTYPWAVTAGGYNGSDYCIKSGGYDYQNSNLSYQVTLTGPGTIVFWAKVSSEEDYDWGRFLIDNSQKMNISGEVDWTKYSYELTAGTHTLIWTYYKDVSSASGDDCFYVDDITITSNSVATWQVAATNVTESPYVLSNNAVLSPETDYQVKLIGYCPWTSEQTESNAQSFTTSSSCETPTGLAESEVTNESAKITWDTHGLTTFNLRYRTGTEEWETKNNVACPYTIEGLGGNTTYEVQVQATCNTTEWSTALNFTTKCDPVTDLPWSEDFESYDMGNFSDPCWVNKHIAGSSTYVFQVYTSSNGTNTTHQLQLPDQNDGNMTKLVLPGMTLPNDNYAFFIDVYRTDNYSSYTTEGIRVFASTNGEIEGATELAFIPRVRSVQSGIIPAEDAIGWYTYALPINMSGNCYIILRGESKYGNATYMDNFIVASCYPVGTLSLVEYGSTSAKLSWTLKDNTQTAWDVAYKMEGETNFTIVSANTNENYLLEGLTPEKAYTVKVRANCGGGDYGVWSNEINFTTPEACPVPTGLAINEATKTAVTADLSWTGSLDVDSYTVQYRTAAGMGTTVLSEGFGSSIPTDWENKIGLLSDVMDGTATLSTGSQWSFGTSNGVFDAHAKINIYGQESSERKGWLITKAIDVTDGTVLSFDLALTAYTGNNVPAPATNGTDDRFVVLVTTDNEATWESLREWNNSGSAYVYNNIANTATGENVILDLSNYKGNSVKIAFYGESTESNADNYLHIDNVIVGTPTPAGNWIDATTNVEEQSFQLTGLTAGTKYDVHVKSNCTSGEYCEPISFTTLAEGNMVFTNATNDGKWGTAGNWAPAQLPVLTDEVILRANATIESNCVAAAKKINLNSNTLTIADGGQLQTDNTVTATVKKNITGYGAGNEEDRAGYYLIGNPLSSTIYVYNTDETYGMRTGTYDLYSWSRTSDLEWSYYGANNNSTLYMYNGNGYLYANAADVTLTFTGTVKANNTDVTVTPSYAAPTETQEFRDWNLYANPFVCNAYLNDANDNLAFYRMNPETGAGFIAATGAIAPMEGIFVQATDANQTFKFSRNQIANSRGQLNINLSKAATRGASLADNAIIRFGEGNLLEKFCFSNNSSKVYIPMEGKDYAVVNAESNVGEMPVSFEAKNNGTYTLSFTNEEVSFAYLHLIDNMTGIETDLLANPSYTFEARTTDYASRFKLVFATGSSTGSDTFAYYSNGNWVINNEGRATLQVVDVNGRILKSESINGCANVNFKAAAGIYMIRLVNGDNVKVQKVVVR